MSTTPAGFTQMLGSDPFDVVADGNRIEAFLEGLILAKSATPSALPTDWPNPQEGFRVWVTSAKTFYVFDGTRWAPAGTQTAALSLASQFNVRGPVASEVLRKQNGRVYLAGGLTNAGDNFSFSPGYGSAWTVGTIPDGFRPPYTTGAPIGMNGATVEGAGHLEIATTGVMKMFTSANYQNIAAGSWSCWWDGISWPAA